MIKKTSQSLIFFGTGNTSLDALKSLSEEFEIEAVITKPDSQDRAGKPKPTVVADWARKHAISVYKPASKTELSVLIKEKNFRSQVGIVLDYGVIIPQDVIDSFKYGILNSHFSLLPKYRGADPIRASILEGDRVTGVTIIKIVAELDAGPILTWAETDLRPETNALQLREELSSINQGLLAETIKLYLDKSIEPIAQDDEQASFTSKTTKEDGLIDPSKIPSQLVRRIKAYTGWPKSYFTQDGKTYVIINAKESEVTAEQGRLSVIDGKLYFGCAVGSLEISQIQPSGKATMDAQSFINGYKF
jgi:methionyl-tRNA formyltransferase